MCRRCILGLISSQKPPSAPIRPSVMWSSARGNSDHWLWCFEMKPLQLWLCIQLLYHPEKRKLSPVRALHSNGRYSAGIKPFNTARPSKGLDFSLKKNLGFKNRRFDMQKALAQYVNHQTPGYFFTRLQNSRGATETRMTEQMQEKAWMQRSGISMKARPTSL